MLFHEMQVFNQKFLYVSLWAKTQSQVLLNKVAILTYGFDIVLFIDQISHLTVRVISLRFIEDSKNYRFKLMVYW